jgi:hypothetical protein
MKTNEEFSLRITNGPAKGRYFDDMIDEVGGL